MIEGVASGGFFATGDAWADLVRQVGLPPSVEVPALAAAMQRQGDPEAETALAAMLQVLVQEPPFGREADVSALVAALGARGLAPLMRHFAGDVFARRRFLLAAGRNLQADSSARLVLAAAVAWDRPCSRSFMEVLAKLTKAALAGDAGCVVAIRELTRLVADRWGDISADASSYTYEEMVSAEQAAQVGHHPQAFPEADRLVELAAEVDALTGETWKAVSELLDHNRMPELLAILRRAPRESGAAKGVAQHIATPARLKSLLEEQPIDFEAVDHLVPALGMSAAEVLLDRLSLVQSREERHPLVERLSALGPAIAPMVLMRLEDERWFVQANMLALLRSWKLSSGDVSMQKHAAHPDARVRREALQLLLESDPARRDEAIVLGLRDHDQQNVHLALQAARGACPPGAVNALAALIGAPTTPAFLRIPAIRLLADVGNLAALDVVLRVVDAGSSLMGKRKLAPKSPEVLAAISTLRAYRGDRRAAELLAAAESSKDDELRLAATVGT